MIRVLLLVLAIALVAPASATAQKDKMHLGEALGAKVTRGSVAAPSAAVTMPVPQDRLTTKESLSPEKKGAR
jgi:hypothetical protein